jgi:hypothetical protein
MRKNIISKRLGITLSTFLLVVIGHFIPISKTTVPAYCGEPADAHDYRIIVGQLSQYNTEKAYRTGAQCASPPTGTNTYKLYLW